MSSGLTVWADSHDRACSCIQRPSLSSERVSSERYTVSLVFSELIEMSVACRGLVDSDPVCEPGKQAPRVFGQRMQEEAITTDACEELETSVPKRSDPRVFTNQHQSNQAPLNGRPQVPLQTQQESHRGRGARRSGGTGREPVAKGSLLRDELGKGWE